MLPESKLSTIPVAESFLTPLRKDPERDYEWGGKDIQDMTKGLLYKMWTSHYDGSRITVTNGEVTRTLLILPFVDHHSFAFDQNMQPCVVYVQYGLTKFWYYDTIEAKHITLNYGAGYEYPQVTLDDHRQHQLGISDIILSYIREDKLYYRLQRERYLQENFLKDVPHMKLTQTGMTRNYRFRWRYVRKKQGE